MKKSDAGAVSALGIRSKASWGYTDDEMLVFREELTLSETTIEDFLHAQVTVEDDLIVGYFALVHHPEGHIELEFLFVDPAHFGKGIGRALLQAAIAVVREMGAERMTLISDPNAAAFYQKHGAVKIGDHQSSIAGRTIPVFSIQA